MGNEVVAAFYTRNPGFQVRFIYLKNQKEQQRRR